jgi:predicted enzyme related to lactoylglutathione lyase
MEVAPLPHHNPVVHFEILGKDQKLLEEFYKSIFNWQVEPIEDWYSLVKPGSGINGGIGAREGHTGHVTFYMAVENVEAALALIKAKGGKKAWVRNSSLTVALSLAFLIPKDI